MGASWSRVNATNRPANGNIDDSMRATTTYFGPNFVLESSPTSAHPEGVASMAFWEDIVNVLSISGERQSAEIPSIGNMYAQLPPAELKKTSLIQSNLNIQKTSLRLKKRESDSAVNYSLTFRFDTLHPCKIKLYWGAKEVPVRDNNGNTTFRFVDQSDRDVKPWTFGTFDAGLDQQFSLPDDYLIDNPLMKRVGMGWVSELDLLASPVIIRETEPMPSNEPEASTSEGPLHGEEPFSVIVDNGLPPLPKPLPKLPKSKVHSGPYHLVIVIESDLSSFESQPVVDRQLTFATFSNSSNRLEVTFAKQILIIDGSSYLLQEIFGFSESDSSQASQKECVVCMADVKDTLVLPCRHLCLCTTCANLLRMQGRDNRGNVVSAAGPPKCPICRQIFHSLVTVTI